MSRWLVLASLLFPSLAAADELTLVTGVATPMSERYADDTDVGLKLGLRLHHVVERLGDWRAGVEVAVDWVDRNSRAWENLDRTTFRLRGQVGARLEHDLAPAWTAFGRALVGVEYLYTGQVMAVPPGEGNLEEWDQRIAVPAAELGGGVGWHTGSWILGAQVAVPVAFHPDRTGGRGLVLSGAVEETIAQQALPRAVIEGPIVEVDVLLTAGTSF